MPPRSAFRVLPPAALAAVVAAVLLVVSSGSASGGASGPAAAPVTTTSSAASSRRTYRVRRGDDLSSVAERFGVPLESVLELNPRVDPQSVSIGTRLRLRR